MSTGHSRYPVLDTEGRVVGLIHLADVMDAADPHAPIDELIRPASVLSTLMSEFTFEDLAEELVGEITRQARLGRPEKVIPLGVHDSRAGDQGLSEHP